MTYIDGGHSYDTCRSDYLNLKDVPVVVFDDFFTADANGNAQPEEHLGTNKVMENDVPDGLRKTVLPSSDPVLNGGITHLGVVLKDDVAALPTDLIKVPIVVHPRIQCLLTISVIM